MERSGGSDENFRTIETINPSMLISVDNEYTQSSLLNTIPHIVHGYTFRALGDMRQSDKRKKFLQLLHPGYSTLIMGEQVHGVGIEKITRTLSSPVPSADGLIVDYEDFKDSAISVGVIVADCVPVLFTDSRKKRVAVVHAGWRGTLGNIAGLMVQKMKDSGSKPKDIYVSIGPHIGMCCYDISEDRADKFQKIYGKDPRIVSLIRGKWYMDIGYINLVQLQSAGILREHIDTALTCTSCQIGTYYSYRKDTHETFGEILGVIGFSVG